MTRKQRKSHMKAQQLTAFMQHVERLSGIYGIEFMAMCATVTVGRKIASAAYIGGKPKHARRVKPLIDVGLKYVTEGRI